MCDKYLKWKAAVVVSMVSETDMVHLTRIFSVVDFICFNCINIIKYYIPIFGVNSACRWTFTEYIRIWFQTPCL